MSVAILETKLLGKTEFAKRWLIRKLVDSPNSRAFWVDVEAQALRYALEALAEETGARFVASLREVRFQNGSILRGYPADRPEALLGNRSSFGVLNHVHKWGGFPGIPSARTFASIRHAIKPGGSVLVTTDPIRLNFSSPGELELAWVLIALIQSADEVELLPDIPSSPILSAVQAAIKAAES